MNLVSERFDIDDYEAAVELFFEKLAINAPSGRAPRCAGS